MQIIKTNSLRILIADEGKHIRSVNDVYIPEHTDETTGETIPEYFPGYSEIFFLGAQVSDEEAFEIFIEEPINE